MTIALYENQSASAVAPAVSTGTRRTASAVDGIATIAADLDAGVLPVNISAGDLILGATLTIASADMSELYLGANPIKYPFHRRFLPLMQPVTS